MNELIRHIEYLLRSHDCVVVPGFGAFVTQHHKAYYDAEKHCFFPPSVTVIFNPELNHNDGLLASSVSRKEKISFERATRLVTDEVAGMKLQLKADGELQTGHLGRFVMKDDKIIFHPENDNAVSPNLSYLKTIEITRICDRKTVDKPSSVSTKRHVTNISGWGRIAASIAIIFVMGILFSTPILSDRDDINFAGMNFIQSEISDKNEEIQFTDIELNIAFPEYSSDSFALADTTDARRPISRMLDSDPYYLVVASLANKQQAETFVGQHAGKWQLEIIERQGKTRVIATTGTSAGEVMKMTADKEFAGDFPDAWPCHR